VIAKNISNLVRIKDMFYEYLLVITPDLKTTEAVSKVKTKFKKMYDCKDAIMSKPHITIVNFS
jgi:hypothetical protein